MLDFLWGQKDIKFRGQGLEQMTTKAEAGTERKERGTRRAGARRTRCPACLNLLTSVSASFTPAAAPS